MMKNFFLLFDPSLTHFNTLKGIYGMPVKLISDQQNLQGHENLSTCTPWQIYYHMYFHSNQEKQIIPTSLVGLMYTILRASGAPEY